MKKFGIIVCPDCRKAKIVNLTFKSTKCFNCNKNLKIEKLKIIFESNSNDKVRNAIGLLNADLDGNLEKFKKILENKKIYK